MKKFDIQFSKQLSPQTITWKDRMAQALGGLAIILIVIMALPVAIILFLWVQYYKFFPSKKLTNNSYLDLPWESFIENPHITIKRKMNYGLEKYAKQDPVLAEAIEFEEFVAYCIQTEPEVSELQMQYVDYYHLEVDEGVFFRGLSPAMARDEDPIIYLDYKKKKVEVVYYIPANAGIEMRPLQNKGIHIIGHSATEHFDLIINIKPA